MHKCSTAVMFDAAGVVDAHACLFAERRSELLIPFKERQSCSTVLIVGEPQFDCAAEQVCFAGAVFVVELMACLTHLAGTREPQEA